MKKYKILITLLLIFSLFLLCDFTSNAKEVEPKTSSTDENWKLFLENIDIDVKYLEPNKYLGLYWDSFVEGNNKESYLYLCWTSTYYTRTDNTILYLSESNKSYYLYSSNEDMKKKSGNWLSSTVQTYPEYDLSIYMTPIAGIIDGQNFGLPLKRTYTFTNLKYGYEGTNKAIGQCKETMTFDLGLVPKHDGKNSMQLCTHGYEIIEACEAQSYIESVCSKIPRLNAVDFKANPYYTASTNVIDLSNLLYKISDINPKLKSFVVKENYFIEEDTPELEDVIVEGNFSLFQFPYLHEKHLIYTKNPETVKINNTDLFDDVRFILQENNTEIKYFPIDTGESGVITTKSNPFYIPEGDHPEYNNLVTYYLTKSHVQTYNPNDYTLKLKQFESNNGNIYYTNDETLSIDTLESYITEMTEGNFDFTATEALDTQYQAYLETKPEVPTPTPSDNDDFVDESESIQGYQALGSIYYTSSKSLDDILKIASNYMLQKDGVRTDEEKEVSFHVDEDTLSVIIKVDGKIVASTVSKLHKLDTKDYGEFIYLQNVGTFYGVLLFDTTSKTTKTPEEIYDYLLNEITYAKTIPAPDFKDFSLTTPSAVDISSSLIHTNGNKYKLEIECLSFDLSQAKDISTPDISHKEEDIPNNPDDKDKDKEETPNNPTDKDKDKDEDKNQTDVKDEGTSNIFNDFKDNFENNKTFKTMSIILGTILGLVLIYVGYLIIKKIHKWLKK